MRSSHSKGLALALSGFLSAACAAASKEADPGARDAAPTSPDGSEVDGFVPFRYSAGDGKLSLTVPAWNEPLLYYVSLPAGLGSNDVGLDRGQLGPRRVVEFRREGDKVLLVAPNLTWRSSSDSEAVRDGVRDSFAESVIWGFEANDSDGAVTVDATDFLLRDAHGIARTLRNTGQGDFRLDASRSAVLEERLKNFPDNTEIEVLQTFVGSRPGGEVRSTAADPSAVSLRVRHSFVRLPALAGDADAEGCVYRPRRFDPRSGYFAQRWNDVSSPIDEPTVQRRIQRHHLCAKHPIVYYVDRAAPEPVRTALIEGALYWKPVFEAAGFPGGYRVELLPEDADTQDVRINVIQWVSRSTRGWSYGMTVSDPRTGEILKGHVTLGALRVRQDVLLMEGLLSPYAEGGASDPVVIATALDRIRQLSAHEVGHTLGLAHNFAASVDGRSSVMDYPAPLVQVKDGELDLSEAYYPGCGPWDELSVRYGYVELGEGAAEEAGLEAVLREMRERGLHYASDRDARGSDRAHPLANLWDNGTDPVAQLFLDYEVREIALERFSPAALKPGAPFSALEDTLVPLYLRHRYQLEAAIRQVAGVDYDYEIVGRTPGRAVLPLDGAAQERALDAALLSLEPEFLELSERIWRAIPPRPPGHARGRESFQPGGLLLDPLQVARVGASLTLDLLLDPARAERLVDQARRDPSLPSLNDVLRRLTEIAWGPRADESTEHVAIRGELRTLVLDHLMDLASDAAPGRVQPIARAELRTLRTRLSTAVDLRSQLEADLLRHYFEDPRETRATRRAPRVPPGSPIGECSVDYVESAATLRVRPYR